MSLAIRSTADERMDTDCADFADYRRCLRDLSRVNTVTLTHRPMLAWLARETVVMKEFSLLDVACGYGDALRHVHRWAARRGVAARLVGVDLNPWATQAARDATAPGMAIEYRNGDVFATDAAETFDFVVSSQFTHHLTDQQILGFIAWMENHARRGWFIGDLHRHWLPYYGFGVLAWAARWHHFVLSDGRISIARSFVADDWRRLIRAAGLHGDVEVRWHMPFRLCVARHCPTS
ncbi:MAG TPA: methyltransferase domain-containing protein [Acetobacteraceae bacterium]|nr:methyltransferase domain-containing protein [Acetobacteraceae bacterium]